MMTNTTDYNLWLEENDPDGHEEIFALYQAATDRETVGIWEVTVNADKTFITGSSGTLRLLSEKAREAFVRKIDTLKSDPEMDMESWYGYERNMANPKA